MLKLKREELFSCTLLNKSHGNHRLQETSIPCNILTLEKLAHSVQCSRGNQHIIRQQSRYQDFDVIIQNCDIEIITNLVLSEDYKKDLIALLLNNMSHNQKNNNQETYEFYTDGSLINRGATNGLETKMGSAWIQTQGPSPNSSFCAGVQDWPSSCKAEATAILTAILTIPRNNKAIIYTDSQNCIDTFAEISKANPKLTCRRWLKIKNWSIWHNISDLIHKKEIQLSLKKVKAHSGNVFNERVDQLAKAATQLPAITWSHTTTKHINAIPIWYNRIIDIAPRNFIKEIIKISNLLAWIKQN
jgi:ribonuclease HI